MLLENKKSVIYVTGHSHFLVLQDSLVEEFVKTMAETIGKGAIDLRV